MTYENKINFEKFAAQFAKENTAELIKQLSHHEAKYGASVAEDLTINFLSSFVASAVYKALTDKPNDRVFYNDDYEERDPSKQAIETLARIKAKIQHGVAVGFQGALKSFAGHDIEYYCNILPIPEVPTKLVS